MFKLYLLIFFPIIAFLSCNTIGPTEGGSSISLSVEDASCTEIWLHIKTSNIALPYNGVIRSNNLSQSIRITNNDTSLYLDSFLPNKNYSFQISSNFLLSNSVSTQTMDTTGHDYSWQTYPLGDGISTSLLFDVAIIDDNNFWSVGEVYLNDSTGKEDPYLYNLVKWNGTDFKNERVYYYYLNQPLLGNFEAIKEFNNNDIYLSNANFVHWDGVKYTSIDIPNFNSVIKKIWGEDNNKIYLAGMQGAIGIYDGYNCINIAADPDLDVLDIYGAINNKTGKDEIICTASKVFTQFTGKLYQIVNDNAVELSYTGLPKVLNSIWFKPNRKYIIAGDGVYTKTNLSSSEWKRIPGNVLQDNYMSHSIYGEDVNNIFIAGAFGEIMHFNGYTWKNYLNETNNNGIYYRIVNKGNLVVAVGTANNKAIITIGRKINR